MRITKIQSFNPSFGNSNNSSTNPNEQILKEEKQRAKKTIYSCIGASAFASLFCFKFSRDKIFKFFKK